MSVTINELLAMELADPTHIWGPTICTHNLVMIYGPTGIGKTYVCMKLAHTIAAGGKWLAWDVERPRRVLYVDGELGLAAVKRRYRAIQSESFYSPLGSYFRVLSRDHCGARMWNISSPKEQKLYNAEIDDAEVIIFDNLLSCSFPIDGRDDDVKQWDRIVPWFHALRSSGRTVIMVHHTGKSGQQLGTSVKENWLDTNIELRACPPRAVAGTEFEMHFRKTRDVKRSDAQSMHVEYIQGDDGVSRWYWETLLEDRRSKVASLKNKGLTKREVAAQLGMSFSEVETEWRD